MGCGLSPGTPPALDRAFSCVGEGRDGYGYPKITQNTEVQHETSRSPPSGTEAALLYVNLLIEIRRICSHYVMSSEMTDLGASKRQGQENSSCGNLRCLLAC